MSNTDTTRGKCGWLCEGYPPDKPEGWYPDSPSDLVYECEATAYITDWGWYCDAGHEWKRGEEYFDDDEKMYLGIY